MQCFVQLMYRCFLPEGKPIPTELRNEEAALRQEIDLEDEQTAGMPFYYFSLSQLFLLAGTIARRRTWRWNIQNANIDVLEN